MDKLRKLVEELLAEILEEEPELIVKRNLQYDEPSLHKEDAEEDLEESSATGGIAGYETPFAFSSPMQDPKKKRAVKAMNWPVVNTIDESNYIDEHVHESVDPTPQIFPKKRIAESIKSIRYQLEQIEKTLDDAKSFKEQVGMKPVDFYKRTHHHLRKIGEQINRIMNKIYTIK